jgi:phosphate transport system substrate-binding protein
MKAREKGEEDRCKTVCNKIREDGHFVEGGENDNLIVQKVGRNPVAVGVFGFSFLEANLDTLRDVKIDGVPATYETISAFQYPASRPLFIYVKAQHVKAIRGLREFLDEYTSERAWGPGGYLARRGLIPSPDDTRAEHRQRAVELKALTPEDLA